MKKRINGTGSIWKRGKVFVWQYRDIAGKAIAKTIRDEKGIPVKTKVDAEKIVACLQTERNKIQAIESKIEYLAKVAENKKLIDRQGKIKISDIWNAYLASSSRPDSGNKTLQGYREGVNVFLCWISKEHPAVSTIDGITEEIASRFAAHYWQTGISERTYNARISTLKLIFKILHKESNPFLPIRKKTEQQQSRNAFTVEQLKAISNTIDNPSYHMLHKPEMRLMLLIMLYTGCRGEDACLMCWHHIDLQKRTITYIPLKTARKRPVSVVVPIAPVLEEELVKQQTDKLEKYVLPNVAKRYMNNPCGISIDVSRLLENSGIKTHEDLPTVRRKRAIVKYSMHSFRHTFCTMAINNGIPITAIQSIVGHSTAQMTSHYSHVSLETKESVVKSLPSFSEHQILKADAIFSVKVEELFSQQKGKVLMWLDKTLSEKQKSELLNI